MLKYLRAAGVAALAAVIPAGSAALVASPAVATTAFRPPAAHLVRVWHDNVKSSNWSGYAVSGATFNDVKGTWKEPAAKCSGSGAQYASFWVGIDGYTSTSVEQLGTDSDCQGGTPQYYGWYEMYPANSVNLGSKYPVKPGDTLTAEVKVTGTSFKLSMKSSEGWTFSIDKTSSALKKSSAEWVIESPEICSSTCSLAKLADFGKVTFTASEAATTSGDQAISSFTGASGPHRMTMMNKAHTVTRAVPGVLTSNGEGFTTTWKHS